jgi:hypothetical protein
MRETLEQGDIDIVGIDARPMLPTLNPWLYYPNCSAPIRLLSYRHNLYVFSLLLDALP